MYFLKLIIKLYNQMFFQKKKISTEFSPWFGLNLLKSAVVQKKNPVYRVGGKKGLKKIFDGRGSSD